MPYTNKLLTSAGRVLVLLAEKKQVTRDDLAVLLDRHPHNITHILVTLEKEGLVTCDRLSTKLRVWRLNVTDGEAMNRILKDGRS